MVRVGHHSTSDDSTAYRTAEEIKVWNTTENPISKLKNYLSKRGWWDEEEEAKYVKQVRQQVLSQISLSEKTKKPDWRELFDDVYQERPHHLE